MSQLLTPEDSKRVADALIEKIEDEDITGAVRSLLHDLFWPTRQMWKQDWLPLTIEEMCDKISSAVGAAAREAAEAVTKRSAEYDD